jgi:hypothetical protein
MSNTALTLFNADSLESQLAKAAVLVKSGMLPKAYDKPEAVLAACTLGSELGFSPMQALQVINVIDGKPTLGLNGMLALAQRNGGRIETLELSDTVCKVRVTRNEQVHEESYTIGDAAKAGLAGKSNWVKMPKQMLYARAVSTAIRRMFADVLSGLYSTEEMQDSVTFEEPAAPKPAGRPKKADSAPVVVVDAEVVATPTPSAPSAPTAVLDIPMDVEPEPELPKPTPAAALVADVMLEKFDQSNPAHIAIVDQIIAKHGIDAGKRAKVIHYVSIQGYKVGELDLEIGRKATRKESA